DTVDISMEMLASVWTCDPCDLRDPGHTPPCLQDTLLQREEELARLQEENKNLREFLNSSFVRNLEQKAKVGSPSSSSLTADGRRNLKRSLMNTDEGTFQDCSYQILSPQQASKRVCRNLTAKFCSESSETSSSSEPNLDLWVLRTLGLKDHNTIDSSLGSTSTSHGCSLSGFVDDAAATSSLSSSSDSSFSPSLSSSVQRPTRQTDYRFNSTTCREAIGDDSQWMSPGSAGTQTPQTPVSRTDLLFSMCLSPSSSVKTHSFPQGQAFVRKDPEGRWNFTWVPRQGPEATC
uniref:Geminin coiled-coil domain containing n=1 Tax=Mola mola TaxID=94237 RepID=A0A3Q3W6Y8_MOLML